MHVRAGSKRNNYAISNAAVPASRPSIWISMKVILTPATANGYSHTERSPTCFRRRSWKDFCTAQTSGVINWLTEVKWQKYHVMITIKSYSVTGTETINSKDSFECRYIQKRTGKFLAKYNKFSRDMKPPPLPDAQQSVKWIWINLMILTMRREGRAHLKSVDGSFPCQPISFHCSDTIPCSSSSGKASFHRSLRAS